MHFGWSAIAAFGAGFVGAALGMKVAWYVGTVARLIGEGANVGHQLTGVFSGIVFLGARWVEKRLGGI
jgi:hypothetical protein